MVEDREGDERLFLRSLARLTERLAMERRDDSPLMGPLIRAHLGTDAQDLPVLTEQLESWELPNLQLAVDDLLGRPEWGARILGVSGVGRRFSHMTLSDLWLGQQFGVGPPEYVNAPVGPGGETLPCLELGLLLASGPEGPLCLFVRQGEDNGPAPGLSLQAVGTDAAAVQRVLRELRELVELHDVFRGQVIGVEVTRFGRPQLVFLERPRMERSEIVLPEGVLERIEGHVMGPTVHREALLASGRHLARGLLLWGPPGTGKTHTVRYLTGRLDGATVIVLSGSSLGMIGAFGALARRLAPAVVVLDDVDLVAQERVYGPGGSSPALFELMNQMSGLGEDADVAFVLTTNRPDVLEPALAARPGRVDLAVEIPLPDAAARRRLIELYGRGLALDVEDWDIVVARTDGVAPSFVKELLRKAALAAAADGRTAVGDRDVTAALDELLDETAALTRVLLGGEPASDATRPPHQAWLEGLPGVAASVQVVPRPLP